MSTAVSKTLARLQEALAEALVPAELGAALDVLAEATDAIDAGFFRFPRTAVNHLGELVLRNGGATPLLDSKPVFAMDLDLLGPLATPFQEDGTRSLLVGRMTPIALPGRGAAGVVLARERTASGDLTLLTKLLPPLEAAYRRILRFETLSGRNLGLTNLIEKRLGACTALASGDGTVLWMSRSARELVSGLQPGVLERRIAEAMRSAVAGTHDQVRKFLIREHEKDTVYGSMSFVRETPETSIHYIAVEFHSAGVDTSSDRSRLSNAEREVYDLLVAGLSYPRIAKQRFISLNTVRSHVASILRKLNVASRIELMSRNAR